ncbi:MAG: GntR family transcriptional regulator [Prevotella sp.]|nr:GntR family transcriptional regulator [Prevotella sp.]
MMFSTDKPIFQQIADRLADEILAGRYGDDDRVPSVREYAVMLEVNTNTAVKAYELLSRENIIYNKRGMGYFVTPGARQQVLSDRREAFLNQQLPEMFRQMRLLGLGLKDIEQAWQKE